jgi:TetR/AcrR family transcriptional regulator
MKTFTSKGEKARQRLLEAAIRLFAEKGFAGTSLDEIVDSAQINKRMVYHYFGNKEKLYQEALLAEYSKLEMLETKNLHPGDPIEKIVGDIVSTYFSFLKANPEFVQLILWENLNNGRSLEAMQVQPSKSPMMELMVEVVHAGQKEGTIRADIDSRFLLISLIGNCMVYYSNRFTLSRALEMDLASPKVLRQAEKSVAALILNGIKA